MITTQEFVTTSDIAVKFNITKKHARDHYVTPVRKQVKRKYITWGEFASFWGFAI